jgi:hypothetical protein
MTRSDFKSERVFHNPLDPLDVALAPKNPLEMGTNRHPEQTSKPPIMPRGSQNF